jgi:outer membrane protein OmpA-like peptidoglycan-associated protein
MMKRARLAALFTVVLASSILAGCNAFVQRKQYDTLESKYQEQVNLNKELTANLDAAKAGQADLQNAATTSQQRAMAAESETARLREEVARQQAAPPKVVEVAATPSKGAKPAAVREPKAAAKAVPGGEYILPGDMITGTTKLALTPAGKKRLEQIAAAIKHQYPNHSVRVCGHTDTDAVHHWQDNLELSAERALVVARELIAAGVSAKHVEVVGEGQYHPISKEKAKNRRVVIEIVKD